jgi:hypothetical protein
MNLKNGCFALLFALFIGNNQYGQNGKTTNCFYDNDKTHTLNFNPVYVTGEVFQAGVAKTDGLQLHSVIVKETYFYNDSSIGFTGAYRYDGYSLKELLDPFVLNKRNALDFPPLIDLFVEISNDNGEKVVLSWGKFIIPTSLIKLLLLCK